MNRNTLFAFVSAALVSASLALSGCFAQAPDSDEGTGEVGEDTSEAKQPVKMRCLEWKIATPSFGSDYEYPFWCCEEWSGGSSYTCGDLCGADGC